MKHEKIFIDKKIRTTTARLHVLTILKGQKKPIDSSDLLREVKKRSVFVDRATVFRIINLFVSKGIVRRIEFQEGKYRYELASLPHHHHAVCIKCGLVKDFSECDVESIAKMVSKKLSFTTKTHSLELFGMCASCQ